MANPNALVSTVLRFEPPLDRPPAELLRADRGLSVELADGRLVRLDPADPRSPGLAQVLDGLRQQRLPVYLEVDPASSYITQLFIPLVTRVHAISSISDGLSVELERSHARHMLRRGNPDFEELERQLRDGLRTRASIIVTENHTPDIIDIRDDIPMPDVPPPFPRPELPLRPPRPKSWPQIRDFLRLLSPWLSLKCVSASEAQQIFDKMAATSCDPLTVPAPCIPFRYPDDGCWVRAHEMCRLMIDLGHFPKKVWSSGSLHVATKNSPACAVSWSYHVAPTLCVRGPGVFQRQDMVIDPALFTTPVDKATWVGAQGDPKATLKSTAASVYQGALADPNYVKTNKELGTYRLLLQARSVWLGPPPYAHCP